MPESMGIIKPKVKEFYLNSRLVGSFDDMISRFSDVKTFISKKQQDNSLVLVSIESRDMQKNPFLFIVLVFKPDSITVQYSIPLDSSEKMRKIYVIRALLELLALVTDLYIVDQSALYTYINSSIDDILTSLSPSYSSLFNSYDSLFSEFREIRRLNLELQNSNKELTAKAVQMEEENKRLNEQLDQLHKYSDQALMVMVEDWIDEHNNTIDLDAFSNTHHIPISRVEQILNKMVTEGYISIQG